MGSRAGMGSPISRLRSMRRSSSWRARAPVCLSSHLYSA
jgi:hypothetical protein